MYIKKLELLNFQVIENFNADFSGNVYFVTGDNELGKSTLLKAIGALLTGQRDDVLRNGASKGFAKMVVGDDGEEYEVSLSFTEKNPRGTLTIKQASTGMQTNNVSMLQKIFGYQDFDAVEFSRWSETAEGRRKQIAVVMSLIPPEIRQKIEEIDAKVSILKNERTGVNRDVKTFDSLVSSARASLDEGDIEKYTSRIDVSDLMERQRKNIQLIEKAKTVRAMREQRKEQLAQIPEKIKANEKAKEDAEKVHAEAIIKARQEYENAVKLADENYQSMMDMLNQERKGIDIDRDTYETRLTNAETWLEKYEANNPEKTNIPELLANAEAHNRKADAVEDYKAKKEQYNMVVAKALQMDAEITDLAREKAELIQGAKLPVNGLSFTEDGLTLNDVPFIPGKVSDSQTMEIAAKLVIASNPTVKVFRIARGESLGEKRLKAIVDIARKNGYQGFIENVVRGQEEMRIEEYTER